MTYSNYKEEITENKQVELPQSSLPENSAEPSAGPDISFQGGSVVLEKPLVEKSILMVVAFKEFEDKEYFTPKQYFLAAGVKSVLTASNQMGMAIGADGEEALVNLLLKDVNVSDFDAVVFVGGLGALKYLDNGDAYRIAKEAVRQGKLLSAISFAPAILAKSGVLEGKHATAWSSDLDKTIIGILQDNAVIFEDKPVVRDGKIITANGPEASDAFSLEIIDFLMQY